MGRTSLSVFAIAAALAVTAGGCALGPDQNSAKHEVPTLEVSYGPTPSGEVERVSAEGLAGPVQQASGVLDPSKSVRAISSAFKQGASKVSDMLTPTTPVKSADDPIALATDATPSPGLYVAVGRLSEQSGKVDDARQQYEKALQLAPGHAGALLSYARLRDRQGELEEAIRLYQRAAKAQPRNAAVFNDLGVCLARRQMFDASITALEQAIQIEPKDVRYRNNIAMVLVETGWVEPAVLHLKAVQREAVAYYNVGYILQKKGNLEAARTYFTKAVETDPSLAEARIWLQTLASRPGSDVPSPRRAATDARFGGRPTGSANHGGPSQQAVLPSRSPASSLPIPQAEAPRTRTSTMRQLPSVSGQRLHAAPRPDELVPRPRRAEPAPLPPPSFLGAPVEGGNPGRAGVPVVEPLPPVQTGSSRR